MKLDLEDFNGKSVSLWVGNFIMTGTLSTVQNKDYVNLTVTTSLVGPVHRISVDAIIAACEMVAVPETTPPTAVRV